MSASARHVLEEVARGAVLPDLDQLHGELEELRREITVLERLAGLPVVPLTQRGRRARVAELRSKGLSIRTIAGLLRTSRHTVTADLRALGAAPPARILGRDGRQTRPRHRTGQPAPARRSDG